MEYADFFYQAAIYLLAAVLAVPLAKRLGFGSVLGYLIAGIIIGPFVLGKVGNDTQHVMHFAEFGVVLMLFLIGLELRPATLWKLRGHIFGLGLLQVVATTFAFTGVFVLLGYGLAIALAVGMIFSMSSTAIVMQIFTEKKWMGTPVGQSTFSVLLFQDIAIIPIMAILPLLGVAAMKQGHSGTSYFTGWQHAGLTLAAIIGIILGGRFLLRPLFRFIARANLREIFTAASLLVVISSALVMQALGLSAALGTFLAGAVLAESEYRHELEADIEPFKGLLLGIFFISVGANIDFTVIKENPLTLLELVALLLFFKAAILFIIAKIFKLKTQDALLFAVTLAQGGEFCFVLLSFAVGINLLPTLLASELIAAVAISMLMTPLMIIFYEKVIAAYYVNCQKCTDKKPAFDKIEDQKHKVVIAGFGRVGQIIGRILLANKMKPTVLDLNVETIEIVRKFGFEVFYGDASRLDLLETAGIKDATLFVIAIDDSEKALEIAKMVRDLYPNLKILCRVRGRTEAYDFMKEDFNQVYRETFESALVMGEDALKVLGVNQEQATRMVNIFREHDEASMRSLAKLYDSKGNPRQDYINEANENRKNLEEAILADKIT
ncbi:MAG: monovalent cation:proton antiporter-2 (CPA2) family protein [Candidatus Berkiella sp.]